MPVHLVHHPIAQDALLTLRDKTTHASHFRRLAYRLTLVLAAEATRQLPIMLARVETPLESADGEALRADVVALAIHRGSLGMLDGVLELLPHARVWHVDAARDEAQARAAVFASPLPADLSKNTVMVLAPMLATGGTAASAIGLAVRAGARDIRVITIVAAPEGLAAVEGVHSDVHVYTPAVDRGLNADKAILPGLGNFGDRLYGTS